jgi:hypothetical protein
LDPEGLDILKLFGDKIIFNSDYYCWNSKLKLINSKMINK